MTFVSYKTGSKAYCLWDPKAHKIVISSDVTFDENQFPYKPVETPIQTEPEPELHVPGSEGKGKQVAFVFEPGDYDPTPLKRAPHKCTKGPAGSSPDTSSQIPQPATQSSPPLPPLPISHPDTPAHVTWQHAYVEDSEDEVQDIVDDDHDDEQDEIPEGPFPPGDNLNISGPSHDPSPSPPKSESPGAITPSSTILSIPTSTSPDADSLHSTKSLSVKLTPCEMERRKSATSLTTTMRSCSTKCTRNQSSCTFHQPLTEKNLNPIGKRCHPAILILNIGKLRLKLNWMDSLNKVHGKLFHDQRENMSFHANGYDVSKSTKTALSNGTRPALSPGASPKVGVWISTKCSLQSHDWTTYAYSLHMLWNKTGNSVRSM